MHLRSVTFHPEKYPTRDRYPFNLPVYHGTARVDFLTQVTLFVGENGSGKSTLIEALANKCGIHIWRDVERRRCSINPFETALSRFLSVEWMQGPVRGSFFGSSVFQDFAKALDEWAAVDPGHLEYFGGASLLTQSHGQSIMSYFKSRYRIKGLYLLDEPETALSPKTQLQLLDLLASMGAAGHAQFIVATHSPILLACPGAVIYSFDRVPIEQIAYEETDHFKIYKNFLNNRKTRVDTTREERRS
jgi:predicted ATPase